MKRNPYSHRPYYNKDWLYQKYITENLSMRVIADMIPTSMSVICNWLKRHHISAKSVDLIAKRKEHADYMREYYRKYPEKNRQHVRRWRHAKPYLVNLKKEHRNISLEWKVIIITFLTERDGWDCFICKKPMDWKTVSIEHVISPRLGGSHRMDNLRVAHRYCNYFGGLQVRRQIYGK